MKAFYLIIFIILLSANNTSNLITSFNYLDNFQFSKIRKIFLSNFLLYLKYLANRSNSNCSV